jgi:hypothetical protein
MNRLNNKELPAFPISEEATDRLEEGVNIYYGLSKREYFAAKALQGLCAGRTEYEDSMIDANKAVELADLLLVALANER